MLVAFKDARPVELIRHLEYHLLLGVDQAVYIDNSCDREGAAHLSLAPYIERGLVTVYSQLRCRSLRNVARALPAGQRGASSIAMYIMHAVRSLQPPVGSLLLPIDDDEYVVLPSNTSLCHLSNAMHQRRISAAVVPWLLFGSSGHVCQPPDTVLRHFVHRAPLDWPSNVKRRGEPVVPVKARGKPVVLWGVDCSLNCSTHMCMHANSRLQGNQLSGVGFCNPWRTDCASTEDQCLEDLGVYLAHYSIQSEQRRAAKTRRGHTSGKVVSGYAPTLYERVHDTSVTALLDSRLRRIEHEPLRRCATALFTAAAPLRPPIPSAGANMSQASVAESMTCARVQRAASMPSAARPFVFFHLRKTGGSELRQALVLAAEKLRLSHFVPCYANRPGSWLKSSTRFNGTSAARRACHTYGIDSLLSRPRAWQARERWALPFGQSSPALYAGHMPFHVGDSLGVYGWSETFGVDPGPSGGRFDCLLIVRHPVSRFRSCYNERLAPTLGGGRELASLSAEELRVAVGRTDGLHSCINEIARWVGPTLAWGEPRLSRPGLTLNAEELAESRRRIDQCVVGNLVDHCSKTVKLLSHHYSWLAPTLHAQSLCDKKCARPGRCHAHASTRQLRLGSGSSARQPLPSWLHNAVAELNLQDLELYRHAMRRFRTLLACAGEDDVAEEAAVGALDDKNGVLDGANEDPLPTDPTADQHVALPEGCHVEPGVAGPAIAVCFYGVHRSAETIRSIREGLLAPLRRVGSVDIFAHLMQPRVFTNARTGEANVPAPSAASLFSSLAPCGFSLTEQSSADLELAPMLRRAADVMGHGDAFIRSDIRSKYNDATISNLFRSRLSMKLSAELVSAHMAAFGVTYSHIALARPDVLYAEPLLWSPDSAAEVSVPDWGHDFCPPTKPTSTSRHRYLSSFGGVNDRFAIGRLGSLLPLAITRLDWIGRHALMRNSEHLWCTQLAAANVTVGLLRGLRLHRVRADGKNESKDRKAPTPMAPRMCARLHGLNLALDWDTPTASRYEGSLRSMLVKRPWCADYV